MTFLCHIVVLSCKLIEILVKMIWFVLSCNGCLTRVVQNGCQSACRMWTRWLQFWCECQGCQGRGICGKKWTVRSGLKLAVRTFHGILTLSITASLLYYKTGLRSSLESYDWIYSISFFSALSTSLVTYYITCLVNPGYVPIPIRTRHNTFDSDDDIEDLSELPETTKMVVEKVHLKKCGFCGVMQPLRARHCEDCNQCVQRFDHHCPWLETCIGEGNHRFFLVFVISTAILSIWATAIACKALVYHQEWGAWLQTNAVLLINMCITIAAACTVSVLAALHSYLMIANLTTWEMVSRHRISYLKHLDDDLNPFHQGYCCNIYYFLCAKSLQRWDEIYKANTHEEDV